jgi:hypothetical protein
MNCNGNCLQVRDCTCAVGQDDACSLWTLALIALAVTVCWLLVGWAVGLLT